MAVEFLDETPNGGVEFLDEAPIGVAPKPSPISEQEAFKRQYIAEGTKTKGEQAVGALMAAPRAGLGLGKGLLDIILKGVQGVGSVYGEAAGQPTLADAIKNYYGSSAQTALEIIPRLAYELGQGVVGGFQSPKTSVSTLRKLDAIANPITSAIQAAVYPQSAPTQAQAQQAFEENLVNKALAKEGERGIVETAQRAAGVGPMGTTNIDIARAAPLLIGAEAPLAAGVRALASPSVTGRAILRSLAPKVAARTAPATVEQSAMAALDITKEEVARNIPVVNQRVLEIQKSPKTASEALKSANTAESSLYQDALIADKAAAQQGLAPRSDLIIKNVEETLNNIPTLLPEERSALLKDASKRYNVSTTAEGRALQKRLNKEFEAQYANETFDRAAPSNEVKLSVRNSIAEQMDEINKAVTGVDATPYSDIGSLIEFKGNLGKTIARIEGREAAVKTGIESTKASKVPITKYQAAYQAKKSLLSPFQKTQLEKLDENVSRIFKEGKRAAEPGTLDPAIQQGLIQKYTPATPTPSAHSVDPVAPVAKASLETLITEKIKTYPRNIRRDPRVARALAESELGIR